MSVHCERLYELGGRDLLTPNLKSAMLSSNELRSKFAWVNQDRR